MPLQVGELFASIGLDQKSFDAGLQSAKANLTGFAGNLKSAEAGSKLLLGGLLAVGAGMVAFGVSAIKQAGAMEQNQVAFTTMLGSAEKATTLMKELQNFAATTPFQFTEIQGAAKSLLAFGVGAEDVTETLRRLGDIASGVGAPIDEIAQLYGKAKTQGRLFAEDINQLTGRGIPIIKELASQFGVSEDKVRGLVEGGKVGFPQLELAFKHMTATGSQFGGMMDAQSKTLPGMWSNLMDAIGQSSVVVGQEIIKSFDIKDKLAGAIGALSEITTLLQQEGLKGALAQWFPPETHLTIAMVTGAITFGLLPALGGLIGAFWLLMAPLIPFMAAGAAIAALAFLIYSNWAGMVEFFTNIGQTISDFFTVTIPNGIDIAVQWFSELPGKIGAYMDELPGKIGYAIGLALGTLIKFGSDTIQWAIVAIPTLIEQIRVFFAELPGKLWAELVLAYNRVIEWFANLKASAATESSNVIATIVDFFSELPGKMLDIGVNVVQGLWNGIKSKAGWLGTKIKDFVDGLVTGAQDGLEEESPSKVFARIGENIPLGLGIGIDTTANKAQLATSNMINSLPGFGGSINNNSSSRTIGPIYITGSNPDDIWKKFERKLALAGVKI